MKLLNVIGIRPQGSPQPILVRLPLATVIEVLQAKAGRRPPASTAAAPAVDATPDIRDPRWRAQMRQAAAATRER